MRKVSVLIGVCMLVALGLTILAQDDITKALSPIMKDNGATMQSLRRNLDAKSADAVAADAEKLQNNFTQAAGIFKANKVGDAAKAAKANVALAGDIMKAAKAGNLDAAAEPAGALQKSCKGCHDLHREQLPDKTYKFKP